MSTEVFRFQVGTMRCVAISDGDFTYPDPAQLFFTNAPQGELAQELRDRGVAVEHWAHYATPYSALLIDTGRQRLLVDTGAGPLVPTTGKLGKNLRGTEYNPEDIDVVVLTHGHPDHLGGNLDADGKPAYPKASYIVSRVEWEFWRAGPSLTELRVPEHLKDQLRAVASSNLDGIKNRVELVDNEVEVVASVRLVPAPGHTPGQMAVMVSSEGTHLLHLSDAVLHPLQMEHPDWWSAVDYQVDAVVATRHRLLAKAAEQKALVFAMHFEPFPSLGYAIRKGSAWQWQPIASPK